MNYNCEFLLLSSLFYLFFTAIVIDHCLFCFIPPLTFTFFHLLLIFSNIFYIFSFLFISFHFIHVVGSGGILQAAMRLGGRRVRGIETLPEWAKLANEAISSTGSGSGSSGAVSITSDSGSGGSGSNSASGSVGSSSSSSGNVNVKPSVVSRRQ